jgi:hypothetical protein
MSSRHVRTSMWRNSINSKHYSKNMNINYRFDGTLGEFNMEPINLQMMIPNCKPVHERSFTVPRSVEQQLQQSKEIVRLVDI